MSACRATSCSLRRDNWRWAREIGLALADASPELALRLRKVALQQRHGFAKDRLICGGLRQVLHLRASKRTHEFHPP